jgi:hypothetical protein
MKNKIIILVLFCSCLAGYSQKKVTWETLSHVEYTDKYFPKFEEYFLYPKFSDSIKVLEDMQIRITGYFINNDPRGKIFILSKGPMASCFFCGVGGPETAIELQFNFKPTFKTDDLVEVSGFLKLNKEDVEHFNYILIDCKGILVK